MSAGAGGCAAEHTEHGTAHRRIGRLDPEIARDFSNVGPMVPPADTLAIPAPITRLLVMACANGSPQRAGLRRYFPSESAYNEVYTALNMIDYGLDNLPGAR